MLYRYQLCYEECPEGFYGDGGDMRCYICGLGNCTKCLSGTECGECDGRYSLRIVGGVCVECDPGGGNGSLVLCVDEEPEPEPEPEP